MRRFFALALVLLAGPALAGSSRPAACTTSTAQDGNLKDYVRSINWQTCARFSLPGSCTDAQVKALDTQAVIWPVTQAGYQNYSGGFFCDTVFAHAKAGADWRTKKDRSAAYRAADPATQAAVDALYDQIDAALGVQ